jgi:spermidine/putrescine-binding protein
MRKLIVAAGIAIAAVMAAPVSAQQDRKEHRRMNWAENLPEAVRTYHGKRFTIVSYNTAVETGAVHTPGKPEEVKAIRAAARSNKWLVDQLKAKKRTPNDIEWVTRSRNGNLVFYVE